MKVLINLINILGFFENFELNFPGEKFTINDIYYKGYFKNKLKDGLGYESGKDYIYEGEFHQDKKHGKGQITYLNSNEVYSGTFIDNALTGLGKYTWANGDIYIGNFLNGKMHGKGEYNWPEGGKYIGEYINNVKDGKGIFFWNNGRQYDGEFSCGKPHGNGIICQSGKKYQVEFSFGKIISKSKINL